MGVGLRIRGLLAERGISQSELARRLNLRQSTVNGLINGSSQGSKHLHRIARELGTTPAYLSGETDDPLADAPDDPELTADEQRLLEIYRALPRDDRAALKRMVDRLADATKSS